MTGKKRWLLLGVLFAALLGWLWAGRAFSAADSAYSRITLRFGEPLTGENAKSWLERMEENDCTLPLTLWQEKRDSFVKTETRQGSATVLSVYGDSAAVLPHPLLTGSHPALGDQDGCSISEGLAFLLWGSTDVLGQKLEIGKESYIVRGIFSGEQSLLTLGATLQKETEFSALSLPFSGLDGKWEAEEWLRKNPLPVSHTMVDQPLFIAAAQMAFFLPVWILAGFLFFWLLRTIPFEKIPFPGWTIKILVGLLVFALTAYLCGWDFTIPQRLIPTKWSDFSFWEQLFSGFREEYRNFLSLNPLLQDMAFRENATSVFFVIALVCPALCVPISVLFFPKQDEDE